MEGEDEKVPRPPLPVAGLTLEDKLGDKEADWVGVGRSDVDTDSETPLVRVPPPPNPPGELAKDTEEIALKLGEGIGLVDIVLTPPPEVELTVDEKLPPPKFAAVGVGSEVCVSFPGVELAEREEEGEEV